MKHYRKKSIRLARPEPAVPASEGSAAGEEDPGAALDIDFAPPEPAPEAPATARKEPAPDPPPAKATVGKPG